MKRAIEAAADRVKRRNLPYWEIGFNKKLKLDEKTNTQVPASAVRLDPRPTSSIIFRAAETQKGPCETPSIPYRVVEMKKDLCFKNEVAREKHRAEVKSSVFQEHHLTGRRNVGDFAHYTSFLRIISKKHKQIDDTAFWFVVGTFFTRNRRDATSVENLGRVDHDISLPLKSSQGFDNPKIKKLIIAFQVYLAWAVVGKSFGSF